MGLETLTSLGRTLFRNNRVDEICSEKPVPTALELTPSYFSRFHRPRCPRFRHLPSRSLPTELSRSHFPRFPICPKCPRFRLAPSHRSSPTVSTLPSRSLPMELSPSYFPPFPVRPQCPRFRPAPSQRSSPQAISQGCLSVHDVHTSVSLPSNTILSGHDVHASISLPCNRALPKLFLRATSWTRNFSRQWKLYEIVLKNPRHPLCIFASLPPNQGPPKLFPRFTIHARSSGASSSAALPSRSLQRGLPQAISTLRSPSMRSQLASSSRAPPKLFHSRFTVHPRWSFAPVSLSPAEIPRSYFQAISTLSTPSALVPPFLPFFLPSFLPSFSFPLSFLSSFLFLPSFVPSLLVRLFCLAPSRRRKLNENPSIGDAFGKKTVFRPLCTYQISSVMLQFQCDLHTLSYNPQRITTNRREGA